MANEYIDRLVQQAEAVSRDAEKNFLSLGPSKLNWKPDSKTWSIGQVFDHLVTSNELYFPIFNSILDGSKKNTFWERMPLLPGLFGKMLISSFREGKTRKVNSPKPFRPSTSEIPAGIVQEFMEQQQKLVSVMKENFREDHSKIRITSPASGLVTYSLKDCFTILVLHEERHLRQAHRILRMEKSMAQS